MKLFEAKEGTIMEVFVKSNNRVFKVAIEGDEIVIFSTEEPVKNKVNKERIKELSKLFHAKVEIASGATSREKKLIIKGLNKAETEKALRENNSKK